MAQSQWASGLQVDRWAKELYHEVNKEIYFKKFMGSSPQSMIQVKNELNGDAGKKITFGLVARLSGSGITGDSTLEGNEEAMSTYTDTVTTEMIRNAVRNTGKFDDSKNLHDFRSESLSILKTWMAEYIDTEMFTDLSASPTLLLRADASASVEPSSRTYTGLAAAKAALADNDDITLADISALKQFAVLAPQSHYRLRPIRVEGNEYFVLLVHPEQAYDLFNDSTWQQAQREAQMRGDSNPLFKGALGIWDGVVIHQHENITSFTDGGGASVRGAQALFMGSQAGLFANVGTPMWVEKTFDYGNQLGVAGGMIYGSAKASFNSKDFACITYVSSCSALS